jgi:hypothetical protein
MIPLLTAGPKTEEHKFAVKKSSRFNDGLIALMPTLTLLVVPVLFNKTSLAVYLYTWLNQFSNYQINVWGSFIITSLVYNIGGLIFMLLDFYAPEAFAQKWKLQPEKRINWTEYKKIWIVVFRNQVSPIPSIYLDMNLRTDSLAFTNQRFGSDDLYPAQRCMRRIAVLCRTPSSNPNRPIQTSKNRSSPSKRYPLHLYFLILSLVRRGWIFLRSSIIPLSSFLQTRSQAAPRVHRTGRDC